VLAVRGPAGNRRDDVACALVRYLPPPSVRREIKGKDPRGGEAARNAQRDAPLTLLAFRNTVDHFVGPPERCRVFSGSVKHGTVIVKPAAPGNSETVQHVYRIDGNRHGRRFPEAAAGEIVGTDESSRNVHVGDTLWLEPMRPACGST